MEDSVTIEVSNQKHCSYTIIIAAVGKSAYITIMCMDVHIVTVTRNSTIKSKTLAHKTLVMKKLCN